MKESINYKITENNWQTTYAKSDIENVRWTNGEVSYVVRHEGALLELVNSNEIEWKRVVLLHL